MKMNDKEEYILDTTKIVAAYKGSSNEWVRTVTTKSKLLWFEWGASSERVYQVVHQIKVDLGEASHCLSYDSEKTRNADYERLGKATALDSQ